MLNYKNPATNPTSRVLSTILSSALLLPAVYASVSYAAGPVRSPQSAVPTVIPETSDVSTQSLDVQRTATQNRNPTKVLPVALKAAPQSNDDGRPAANAVNEVAPAVRALPTSPDKKTTAPSGVMTSLGQITTEVEGDQTIVTARLNKTPEWKDVVIEEHGTFLQIKMANTMIPASGEFIDGNGPFLKKIATFQLPNEDGALRFFINQDAAKAKLATTAELLGNRLIITIDHTKLEQLISAQPAKAANVTASEIVAKTQVEKNIPAPGDLIAGSPTDPAKSPDAPLAATGELRAQLTKAAAFFAILLLALIASQVVKAKRRKAGNFSSARGLSQPTALKILSSIAVGPKQKVTLIQVGYQEILIGIGPESINLLSVLATNTPTNNFARHLESANANTDIRLKSPAEPTPSSPQRRPMTAATVRTQAPTSKPTSVTGNRINVGVGDDGAKNMNPPMSQKNDDITRILRDRLRNIPPG